MAGKLVPVTRRSVIQRIRRRMDESIQLRAARSDRERAAVGEYYTVDTRLGRMVKTHVDLEDLARQFGALQPYEKLVD